MLTALTNQTIISVMKSKPIRQVKPNAAARLDPETYEGVDRMAKKQDRSMSAMINILLREALKHHAEREIERRVGRKTKNEQD